MHFTDDHGLTLSLAIQGYQFPNARRQRWDDNWLMVSGRVEHPKGSWEFLDPCLTTVELAWLAGWLDGLAKGHASPPILYFTEPCLTFRGEAGPAPWLEVSLSHECAPPWLTKPGASMEGVTLRFSATAESMSNAAAVARQCLTQFPEQRV